MARRKKAPKRKILPDPLFKSELLAKFINAIMRNGKKAVAEKTVYGALDYVVRQSQGKKKADEAGGEDGKQSAGSLDIRVNEKAREKALAAFKQAIENVTPVVEVKSRRIGGSTYQVPVEIRAERRLALAMRWLSDYARQRRQDSMALRLAHEILDAIRNAGGAVKKKEDVHRMAKANQAFSHYRW